MPIRMSSLRRFLALAALGLAASAAAGAPRPASDQPQWGQRFTRNMVSDETGLPDTFDPATGANVKWSVPLGDETHSTPIVSGGKVLIGTNNGHPRDPRHDGDRGVLMCFDEKDGRFCWQLVVPKREKDRYLDWPNVGIVSPATVEGDRVYLMSNRGEVMCLDLRGMENGNDGPYQDEGRHMALRGGAPMEPSKTDADILWLYDTAAEAGCHQHDAAHCSILLAGPYVYACTSNGVDNTHRRVASPDAPSLVVLDKATGRLAARDREPIGPRIIHSTWASPSLGEVGGRTLVFFGGGDGVCYAFEPPAAPPADGPAAALKRMWRFDCDPSGPKENIHQWQDNRREGPSNISSMPVFDNGRVYAVAGGDLWHGKPRSWLKCIDASKAGDITQTGQVWSYEMPSHCISTPSIRDGLIYIADATGTIHCVDAATGQPCWTHKARGQTWGSTLVADGKVYLGTRRGELVILAAGREKRVIGTIDMKSPISSTPTAANGVLYIATMNRLFAFRKSP